MLGQQLCASGTSIHHFSLSQKLQPLAQEEETGLSQMPRANICELGECHEEKQQRASLWQAPSCIERMPIWKTRTFAKKTKWEKEHHVSETVQPDYQPLLNWQRFLVLCKGQLWDPRNLSKKNHSVIALANSLMLPPQNQDSSSVVFYPLFWLLRVLWCLWLLWIPFFWLLPRFLWKGFLPPGIDNVHLLDE